MVIHQGSHILLMPSDCFDQDLAEEKLFGPLIVVLEIVCFVEMWDGSIGKAGSYFMQKREGEYLQQVSLGLSLLPHIENEILLTFCKLARKYKCENPSCILTSLSPFQSKVSSQHHSPLLLALHWHGNMGWSCLATWQGVAPQAWLLPLHMDMPWRPNTIQPKIQKMWRSCHQTRVVVAPVMNRDIVPWILSRLSC